LVIANTTAQKKSEGWGAMKPAMVLECLPFSYVGVEVTLEVTWVSYKTDVFGSITGPSLHPYMSMYWGV
jgi:FHS family L-fucose permease-like MFS transporter